MLVEYKRDLNHNYLIMHGNEEVDTASYQVRMLIANSISCLLSCRLQGFDGEPLFYYDITSRQAVSSYYEKQKMDAEDIQNIFAGIIHGMEQMSSFLLNAEQLLLNPEYIFMDLENKEIYFCCLPGSYKEIRQQLQTLMEYILPKIDHKDSKAVKIGYGIYRKLMEEQFQIDELKKILYTSEGNNEWSENPLEKEEKEEQQQVFEVEEIPVIEELIEEKVIENKEKKEEKTYLSKEQKGLFVGIFLSSIVLTSVALLRRKGYFPNMDAKVLIGILMIWGIVGVSIGLLWSHWTRKKNEDIMPVNLSQKDTKAERKKEKHPKMEIKAETENENYGIVGQTEELYCNLENNCASLIGKEAGSLLPIKLSEDLIVIGKLKGAADVVIPLPTVSRIHAKIRKNQDEYYITDLNSRNGTFVNGRILKATEEYCLQNQDEVHFGEAEYYFVK